VPCRYTIIFLDSEPGRRDIEILEVSFWYFEGVQRGQTCRVRNRILEDMDWLPQFFDSGKEVQCEERRQEADARRVYIRS
jgi:hypothetical protein